jgi:DNA repair exonuclease SbcCD ATPase subunit
VPGAVLRSEIEQLEGRMAARLAAHENAVSQMRQAAGEETLALREQLAEVRAQLAAVQERPVEPVLTADAVNRQIAARVDETAGPVIERITLAEQNLEEIRKHFSTLQENVAGDLHDFEQSLKTHANDIESARTAMAQTDDLVERVVEALELLQSTVLDQHEEHAMVN